MTTKPSSAIACRSLCEALKLRNENRIKLETFGARVVDDLQPRSLEVYLMLRVILSTGISLEWILQAGPLGSPLEPKEKLILEAD